MSRACMTEVSGALSTAHNFILPEEEKLVAKNSTDDVPRDTLELSARFSTPGNKRIRSVIPLGLRLLEHGVWL